MSDYNGPVSAQEDGVDAFFASIYNGAMRPTYYVQTALGPVAQTEVSLPTTYQYGGKTYKYEGGKYYVQGPPVQPTSYGRGMAAARSYSGAGGVPEPTWQETTELPQDVKKWGKRYQALIDAKVKREGSPNVSATTAAGYTYGGYTAKLPAAQGGPANPTTFLGSDLIRANLEAQGKDPSKIEDIIATYSPAVPEYSGKFAGYQADYSPRNPDMTKSPYGYARYENRQYAKGYGRPRYTPDDVNSLLTMPVADRIQLAQQMAMAGVPGTTASNFYTDLSAQMTAYEQALTAANLEGKPVTAYLSDSIELRRQLDKAGLLDLSGAGYGGSSGGTAKFDPTKTRTTVTKTSRARARALLRSMMTDMNGRAPTEAEVDQFLSKLNSQEAADPTVTTYTYQRDGDMTTTTDPSNVDPALIAERQVKNQNPKEYEAYQRLKYYESMLSLLGG